MISKHLWKSVAASAFLAAVAVAGMSGCVSDGGSGGEPAASASPSSAEGRHLYFGRCTSCHSPEPVNDYTRAEWNSMVSHMRKKAKLKPYEEASLLAYVRANAADA